MTEMCVCCGNQAECKYESYSICHDCYVSGKLLKWLEGKGEHENNKS